MILEHQIEAFFIIKFQNCDEIFLFFVFITNMREDIKNWSPEYALGILSFFFIC